jgi:hypothetical protein
MHARSLALLLVVGSRLVLLGCAGATEPPGESGRARVEDDRGPAAPDPPESCEFGATYTYGPVGGLSFLAYEATLSPPARYEFTLSEYGEPTRTFSCAPALPACGANDVISAYDILVHDLPLPDVQAALAEDTLPFFGRNLVPVDGTAFSFESAGGHGFMVGEPCEGEAGCREITAGIAQLKQRLEQLDEQQLADPSCEEIRRLLRGEK